MATWDAGGKIKAEGCMSENLEDYQGSRVKEVGIYDS